MWRQSVITSGRGLLDEPKKPLGGYRHYPKETAKRLRFIKRAQVVGFTLEEVAGLLAARRSKRLRGIARTRSPQAGIDRREDWRAGGHAERTGCPRLRMRQRRQAPCPIIQTLVTD
jgi:DNA-binding transcriptional MerR regulator